MPYRVQLDTKPRFLVAIDDKLGVVDVTSRIEEYATAPSPAPSPVPAPTPSPTSPTSPQLPMSYAKGGAYRWLTPVSGAPQSFTIQRVYRDQVFNAADTALLGNNPGEFNGSVFFNCAFTGGRYALWLNDQEDIAFLHCSFDNRPTAPLGTLEEACIRIQDVKRIHFRDIVVYAGSPKHAVRIHKFSNDVAIESAAIESAGNGFMLGKFDKTPEGGGDPSLIKDIEFANIRARVAGPDYFNIKYPETIQNLRIHNLTLTPTGRPWAVPEATGDGKVGWSFTDFVRG